jgi:hypothetical protein
MRCRNSSHWRWRENEWCVHRLSSVLADLGLIERALPHDYSKARGGKRIDLTVGISPRWVAAAERWRDTPTLTPKTRKGLFYVLLKVGRWLSATHPAEAAPELWTREKAAQCVAEICRVTEGQWRDLSYAQAHPEKRLSPKNGLRTSVCRASFLSGLSGMGLDGTAIRSDPILAHSD